LYGKPNRTRLWVTAACMLVFALLAWQVVAAGPLTRVDLALTQWLAARRSPGLTQFMLLVSAAHEMLHLLGAAALIALALAWRGHRGDAARWTAVPLGMLVNVGMKQVFLRPRPVLDEPLVQLSTYSFPSGHAAASTVFYGVLCALALAHLSKPRWRSLAIAACAAMVLLVIASRVYLGAHYLSDVLAGVVLELAVLANWLHWFPRTPYDGGAMKNHTNSVAWRYSTPAVALHWILALLIAFMAGLGWYMMTIEDSPAGPWYFDLHKSVGLIVAALVVLRILWRLFHRPAPLPASLPRWQVGLSHLTQWLLYAGMVLVPLTGIVGASYSRAGLSFFGLRLPTWVETPVRATAHQLFEIHGTLVWVLVALVVLHTLGGLKHLLVDRDEVFGRMGWRRR
jgi:cytochrome b561/membrane-associated phospholipid phosphatase